MDWTTLSPNEPPLPFLIQSSPSSSELAPINKIPTSLRELYTIVESSETHTNNNSSNSGVVSSSQEVPSSKYQVNDIEDNLNPSNLVYHHVPIYDWPIQDQSPEPIFNIQLKGNEPDCKIIFTQLLLEAYQQKLKVQPKEMHILLDEQQNIRGITFILSDNSREDYLEFKGSIQYIAPELFVHPEYHSDKVDVWTLGISLYRMLVGRYPFNDKQLLEKMSKFDYEIPKSLSEEARDLIQKLISPEQSRASFEMILVHPWIKSFFQQQDTRPQRPQPQKTNWKKKLLRLLTKILILIVKGPYPPPASYHDLAYTTKKQKQD